MPASRTTMLWALAAVTLCACAEKPSIAREGTAVTPPASAQRQEPSQPEPERDPELRVEETIEGNFLGKNRRSKVLFLENTHIVHAWDEAGAERRDPITTSYPPGHRECKALRSQSQDFLLCMYWFTGPGGGRVDGVLFDLEQRAAGEFFSAAINIDLLGTLCFPEVHLGPMPAFTMFEWSTRAATATNDAEIVVSVERGGWSTKQAKSLRTLPATKKFCTCVGDEECPGEPTPPVDTVTIVYRLTKGELRPTPASRKVLGEIAAQWGHHAWLKDWNLAMRGI